MPLPLNGNDLVFLVFLPDKCPVVKQYDFLIIGQAEPFFPRKLVLMLNLLYLYSSPPLSTGNIFPDSQGVPETPDSSTEFSIY